MTSTTPLTEIASAPIGDRNAPIGVLDSGLGGLSVVRAMMQSLPEERFLYYADSAYCPYGERDESFIRRRTLTIAEELESRGAKAIVVACNTACAAALDEVRVRTTLPVIGLEPAVKPAVALTKTGRVAVLATPRTIASTRLATLVERYAGGIAVDLVPVADWVGIVERGEVGSFTTRQAVARVVRPVVERGADVLVLGCTHFPFLHDQIRASAGADVAIVDSGAAIARRTRHVLQESAMLTDRPAAESPLTFLSSLSDAAAAATQASRMLGVRLA